MSQKTTLNNAEFAFSDDGTAAVVKGINADTGKEEAYRVSGLVPIGVAMSDKGHQLSTQEAYDAVVNKRTGASPFELDFKAVVKDD